MPHKAQWVAVCIGVIAGALLTRLAALLFAARPDNTFVAALLTLTAPLTSPFGVLDRIAGQPRFGAQLDLATMAALLVLGCVTLALQWFSASRSSGSNTNEHV